MLGVQLEQTRVPRVTHGTAPSRALHFDKAGLAASCLVFREFFSREGCPEKEQPTGEEDWELNRAESTAVSTTYTRANDPLPSSTVPAAMKTVGSGQKAQASMWSYHMGVCLLPF